MHECLLFLQEVKDIAFLLSLIYPYTTISCLYSRLEGYIFLHSILGEG